MKRGWSVVEGRKAGGEKFFKFSLDTPLRSERKLCYNRVVKRQDRRIAQGCERSKLPPQDTKTRKTKMKKLIALAAAATCGAALAVESANIVG